MDSSSYHVQGLSFWLSLHQRQVVFQYIAERQKSLASRAKLPECENLYLFQKFESSNVPRCRDAAFSEQHSLLCSGPAQPSSRTSRRSSILWRVSCSPGRFWLASSGLILWKRGPLVLQNISRVIKVLTWSIQCGTTSLPMRQDIFMVAVYHGKRGVCTHSKKWCENVYVVMSSWCQLERLSWRHSSTPAQFSQKSPSQRWYNRQ